MNEAVQSLLAHWESKTPCGPCHYGIGSKFMQVEYPFLRHNLFYYVYVLSCYPGARRDSRFRTAARALAGRLAPDGRLVVEAPHRGLKGLAFCRRGAPSDRATARYREILDNLGR